MDEKDKKIHNLKFEVRQLRERVDKLEQTIEKDQEIILLLLQTSEHLLGYVNDIAKHVIQLKNKEKEDNNDI